MGTLRLTGGTFILHLFQFLSLSAASNSSTVITSNITLQILRSVPEQVQVQWYFRTALQIEQCQARYDPWKPAQERIDGRWKFESLVQIPTDGLDLDQKHSFTLPNLTSNTSYVLVLLCKDTQGNQYSSNPTFFSTNTGVNPPAHYRDVKAVDYVHRHTATRTSSILGVEPFPWTKSSRSRTSPYNTALGIACGVVGFIIINITLVMAVRKYSLWRLERYRLRSAQYMGGSSNRSSYYDLVA